MNNNNHIYFSLVLSLSLSFSPLSIFRYWSFLTPVSCLFTVDCGPSYLYKHNRNTDSTVEIIYNIIITVNYPCVLDEYLNSKFVCWYRRGRRRCSRITRMETVRLLGTSSRPSLKMISITLARQEHTWRFRSKPQCRTERGKSFHYR